MVVIIITSEMKWRARGDEINALILSMMQDAFGDKALDVIADAHYQIGLKGAKGKRLTGAKGGEGQRIFERVEINFESIRDISTHGFSISLKVSFWI